MSGGGGGGRDDSSTAFFFLLIFLFVVGALAWYFLGVYFMEAMRWLRVGELSIINGLTGNHGDWLEFIKNATAAKEQTVPPTRFTSDVSAQVNGIVMYYIKWPAVLVIGGIGVYAAFFSNRVGFTHNFNLETLIKYQAKVWPVINPIVDFDPINSSARNYNTPVPSTLPLFAEALAPEEWIAFHRIKVVNGIPEREATRRAFTQQLGPRWNGFGNVPIHIKALIAAFAVKGAQRREEAEELLGEIAMCWSHKAGLVVTDKLREKIEKILRDPELGGTIEPVAARYAWRTTAMIGMLKWARAMGGVLAPAQFLWLRGADRDLWYPLNNFGRRAFHSEGAGAMAHFMAEEIAQKPLPIPRIDTAIVTLNQYLANTQAKIPPLAENGKAGKVGRSKAK
ncbi:MAG: hypothetical protein GC131_06960 [Alphaproteobacteria bacterium]|nr:hypothetical protein [Alphaproteobacteria bacterium]